MPFQYRTRSIEQWEARANASSGNFISYIKSEYRLYAPARGENCIRVLPPSNHWEDAPDFALDVFVHFGVGPDRGSVICLERGTPKLSPRYGGRMGERCPICQEYHRAQRDRNDALAKELRPTQRMLTFLINRKDEGQGVLIWGMPQTLNQKLVKAARSREDGTYKVFDHPLNGYDIYFDKEGEQLLTKYDAVQLATRQSRVSDRWIDFANDNPLPECLVWRDYEEIKRIFDGGDMGEESEYDEPRSGGRPGYDRPPREEVSSRPPREETYSDRPPREEATGEPPWEAGGYGGEGESEPPGQDEPSGEQEPPPPREEPREPPPQRAQADPDLTRAVRIQRPGSAPPPRGNGAAPSMPPPATSGAGRADQLRSQFLSRRS